MSPAPLVFRSEKTLMMPMTVPSRPMKRGEGADGGQGVHALLEELVDLGGAAGDGALDGLDDVVVGVHALELLLVLEDVQAVLEDEGHVGLVVGGGGALGGLEVAAAQRVHEELEELLGGGVGAGVHHEALHGDIDLQHEEDEQDDDDALVGDRGLTPDAGDGEGFAFEEGQVEGSEEVHGLFLLLGIRWGGREGSGIRRPAT
jgi:hypothetical protein